ncbi:DUF2339 domain-containing protein [Mycobacterium sp. ITM-2016-00318]|uniref:DUF2339 domain-containing protein n=1 Tax=Mycobacterium sp. ITM-2016-00318 TaxID=2099693 RepID=UPI000CFA3044|nr:DUF2339 domain-containing protein [Mycobacterium sp. ITM-2016-00318]WNG95274.1 DUF2339 domain-containing protein [Mycobacterium sp. ITM-2016-00318]
MTAPAHAVVSRLSADFAAMSEQFAKVSADLNELDRVLAQRPFTPLPAPQPAAPYPPPHPQSYIPPAAVYVPPPPPPRAPRPPRDASWIGKVLAVAGVAVTLVGVVLLLVLAAQVGILRPEIRVGAGALLAGALVVVAARLNGRPGGRVGAIALAATGISAAYMDVIAVTTIYHWVPASVGLVIAALIGGGGLTLARRWDSQHLGLLVLVPLIVLAPIVSDGITMLLIAFMLAISAASLLVQLGKDWIWLHGARIAAPTLPLLVALIAARIGDGNDAWLAGGCAIAATLAVVGALLLLPSTHNRIPMALLTVVGVFPVLCTSNALAPAVAALMAAGLAAALLAIVLVGERLPGVTASVRHIWSAASAVSVLIAVTVAFDGEIAAPVLLALAVVVAVAGRRDNTARFVALGFGLIGGLLYLSYAPPTSLVRATPLSTPDSVAILASSTLLIAAVVAIIWSSIGRSVLAPDAVRVLMACLAMAVVYSVTTFTVTAGVLAGGESGGFFAGHMAATICWIAMAATLFVYAARRARDDRSLPIAGGLALVAGSMAKLFLFDLGTLDGMFRVAVFIVVGLVLLGMGAGYARLLAQQDQQDV